MSLPYTQEMLDSIKKVEATRAVESKWSGTKTYDNGRKGLFIREISS